MVGRVGASGRDGSRRPDRSDSSALRIDDERKALMQAGYRLVAQSPDRAITLQDILTESTLSTRAFYRHFSTKDQLLVAIFEADSDRVRAELEQRIASAPSAVDAFLVWIDQWIAIMFEPRRTARTQVFVSSPFRTATGMRDALVASSARSIDLLRQVLERGRADGVFSTVDPAADACALQVVAIATAKARMHGDLASSPHEARRTMIDLASRILRVDSDQWAER